MAEILLRRANLKWYKSQQEFSGEPSSEEIVSGFLYNIFPPITDENLLVDGGYLTRLVYLKNEHETDIVHVRLWFTYPTDETYGDPRGDNPQIREILMIGRQIDREIPPSNAPASEYHLPSDIYMYKIPLNGSNFNNYNNGIELGRIKPNEYIPVWFVLSIPPLVYPVVVTFFRVIAEGVVVSNV